MDGDTPKAKPRGCSSNGALLAWGLAASWLLLLFWPLPLLFEIPLGLHLMVRKSPLRFLSILLSSTTVLIIGSTLSTLFGYFDGRAICYNPHIADEQGMIGGFSPRYRCSYEWFGGDLVMPWMSLFVTPNAVTIKTCYALFGPVRHTYHGPLPDKQNAVGWIASPSCPRVPMARFTSGRFQVENTAVNIPPETATDSLHCTQNRVPNPPLVLDATQAPEVRVMLYQGQCLAIMVQKTISTEWSGDSLYWIISLVDVATGKLITQEIYQEPPKPRLD